MYIVLPFHSAQTGSLLLLCEDLELTGHSGCKSLNIISVIFLVSYYTKTNKNKKYKGQKSHLVHIYWDQCIMERLNIYSKLVKPRHYIKLVS